MALILTRKHAQGLWVGDTHIRLERRGDDEFRVVIEAPPGVTILREEIAGRPIPGPDKPVSRRPTVTYRGRKRT